MISNNYKIQLRELFKFSGIPLILMIVAQFGNFSLALKTVHHSHSELFETLIVNNLNLFFFPFICTIPVIILLQIKKRNDSLIYEYFRAGKRKYFKDLFLGASLVNLGLIIIGNLIIYILSFWIYKNHPELFEFRVIDKISMLKNIRTSVTLTMLFYIFQQWFVSNFIVLFSMTINLVMDNLLLGIFSSTLYLLLTESSLGIYFNDVLDITLVPTYLPGIPMLPFPKNIFQLNFGLVPLVLITFIIFLLGKEKISEI